MQPKRLIITCAIDRTPVHSEFFACLRTYARARRAELVVIPLQYKNPTSRFQEQYEEGEWADEVIPYLCDERRQLAPNLVLYGDIRVQPTAGRPLSGFEVFCSGHSAIFGHPKRALETVPTATRMPRILSTTGAVTIPNYSSTKAGKKGDAHHILGAVCVDIDAKGLYWVRNVSYDRRTKSFTDLDRRYYAGRVEKAPRAASLTYGDVHVGQWSKDGKAERGAKKLFDLVRPRHVVVHDVLDFNYRNHHDQKFSSRFRKALLLVENEVAQACGWLKCVAEWGNGDHELHVTRANHDDSFDRWTESFDRDRDPLNAPYWSQRFYDQLMGATNLFESEYKRLCGEVPVHFLGLNEPLVIKNVNHSFHGHKGANGARGTRQSYVRLAVKVNRGHGHVPGIQDGVFDTGVFGSLDHGYNSLPSSWANAHVVLQDDGKRQLIFVIDERVAA